MVKCCIIFLLAAHCVKTLEHNRDWHSELSLFMSVVHINPNNDNIHNNLGHVYKQAGNLSYAEHLFRSAAEKQPDDIGAYISLGWVLKGQQRYSEAEQVSATTMKVYGEINLMEKGTVPWLFSYCTYLWYFNYVDNGNWFEFSVWGTYLYVP